MNLVLLEPSEVADDGMVRLSAGRATHLRKVLKVAPGDDVRVGVIDGAMGTGRVTCTTDGRVDLQCAFDRSVPERPRVDLLLAVPRTKIMRRLWAQLSSLGVGRVILTNAEKVERDYFGTHLLDEGGYRPLLVEGLQQAKDTRLPVVSIHRRLKVLVEDELDALCPDVRRIVAHPGGEGRESGVASALAAVGERERVLIAVGPEGGWNAFELALLEAHGFTRVGLGPRTLSTTTACVALVALAHDALRRHARDA